jgi:hypothetical protein
VNQWSVYGTIEDFKNIIYLTNSSLDFWLHEQFMKCNYFPPQHLNTNEFLWKIRRGIRVDVWGDSYLIRPLKIETLQHAGHIITVNLTLRFSIVNFYSLKCLAAALGAQEYILLYGKEHCPLRMNYHGPRSPNNKTRIIYALLSHVIERPIVCILHH